MRRVLAMGTAKVVFNHPPAWGSQRRSFNVLHIKSAANGVSNSVLNHMPDQGSRVPDFTNCSPTMETT